jgi:cytochrome c553
MGASILRLFLLIGTAALCLPARADDAKLRAYGKHLAEECASCHRQRGPNLGIAPIENWDPDLFIPTIKAYQSGERPNPAMASVAKSLNDEQMQALALYYASLRKPQPPTAIDATKR